MRSMVTSLPLFLLCLPLTLTNALPQPSGADTRPIAPIDLYRLRTVNAIQLSPDGEWIAYVLTTVDTVRDRRNADIWMVSRDGAQTVQLTNSPDGESQPKFSPDGRYVSFVAKRGEDKEAQVYLLDRRGGDALRATDLKGELDDYVWSPDGKKLLLVVKDPDYSDTAKTKVRTPYVIDRYHFKQDNLGYLDRRGTHLYLFDVPGKKLDTLTSGRYDETQPAFAPDGTQIAFVSNRTEDPDRNENDDIFVMDAKPHAQPRKLTGWAGRDGQPVWSPDGEQLAYLQYSSDEPFTMYGQDVLAVVPGDGGSPRLLSNAVDRPVSTVRWGKDGKNLFVIMEDDRHFPIASFDVSTGRMVKVTDGEQRVQSLEYDRTHNRWALLISTPRRPPEIFLLEGDSLRQVSHIHDEFLAPLQLARVEGFRSGSNDGEQVSGILYRPARAVAGRNLPLILYLHGGPNSQDGFGFDMTRQILASAGYAVAAVNYRGSSGRGVAFMRAIRADWGNKEVVDIVGAADHLIKEGIVDGGRMGIGGWSYGGIVTDYTIATDQRFKAAVSGAGSALQLTMYGVDQYVAQYEAELGLPWKHADTWIKVSYPFFHADRITTPTLFMASQKDFNVPSAGAEQMYQALRSQGVPTELIIYPNQNHGLSVPSYQRDYLERNIRWFDRYLK